MSSEGKCFEIQVSRLPKNADTQASPFRKFGRRLNPLANPLEKCLEKCLQFNFFNFHTSVDEPELVMALSILLSIIDDLENYCREHGTKTPTGTTCKKIPLRMFFEFGMVLKKSVTR